MDNKMDNQEEIRLRLVRPDTSTRTELPVATSGVSAGFPSPADDHLDPPLDLNRELVRNPGATFFARVAGDSMQDDGIADGDLLVVDKSLEAYDGCVAVCFLDGEFTLKRLRMGQGIEVTDSLQSPSAMAPLTLRGANSCRNYLSSSMALLRASSSSFCALP